MNSEQHLIDGKNLLEKGRFEGAQDEFKQAIVHNPRSVDARIGLARIAMVKGDRSEARRQIEEALAINNEDVEAIAMSGILAMTHGKFQEAAILLQRAKASRPDLHMIYYNLAKSYRKLRKLQFAEAAARTAVQLNPVDFQARGELSNILFRTGKNADAIRQLVEAIRINPFFIKGYLVLGEVYKFAGKGDLAIRVYRRGLKHNPLAHILRQHLCGLYALKANFKRAYFHAALLATLRNHFGDYLRLGNYALILGLFEKAEKAFKKSIELKPDKWQAYYNLGELYRAAKLVTEARQQYEAAINRDGKSPKPHNGLGLLLLTQQNNSVEAKKYFSRALELAPKSPVPLLNMALACSASQQHIEARQYAQQVMRLSRPGSPPFQQAEKLIGALSRGEEA